MDKVVYQDVFEVNVYTSKLEQIINNGPNNDFFPNFRFFSQLMSTFGDFIGGVKLLRTTQLMPKFFSSVTITKLTG